MSADLRFFSNKFTNGFSVGLLCFNDTVLLYICVSLHISIFFFLFPSCSLSLGLSLSLLLSLSTTGKVFSGQKLIKIGGKDVVGLDNSDIAVLILGAPGVSSKYMYLCMHVCMGGAVCMFICARVCECVRVCVSRGCQKNRHQCYVSMWLDSIAALVASELWLNRPTKHWIHAIEVICPSVLTLK